MAQPTFAGTTIPAVGWTPNLLEGPTVNKIPLLPKYGGTGVEFALQGAPRAPRTHRFSCETESWTEVELWTGKALDHAQGTLVLPNGTSAGTYMVSGCDPQGQVQESGDGVYSYQFTLAFTQVGSP